MKLHPVRYSHQQVPISRRTRLQMSPVTYFLVALVLVLAEPVRAAKDIPVSHTQAVAGDAVYMPCDISTTEGDSVLLVLWYREDLGTPIYSLDARERDFGQALRWSDEHLFSNRAHFMPEKQPAELGVDHIRESDAGVYRCRVDFKVAQTRNSKVNLTIIVLPQRLVIMDDAGLERTSVVGPYSEGADLILRCEVYGGKPQPTVTWFRNDEILTEAATVVSQQVVRSEIVVRSLGRADLHSQLRCHAANNNKTQPLDATVHVDMNFSPLDVRILGASQPLSAGRRYDLLCQSSGSRPPASITWWRNGQRLDRTKETTSNDGNTTTSTLSYVVKKEDAGKYLACRAENSIISSEGLEDGWKLEVQYTPEAKIQLGTSLNPDAIREGSDVYFDCLINALPIVYKVEWRHNGRTLSHNVGHGVIISNQSLVLQGVSRGSAGNYTCVGYNTEGDGESSAFYLNVMYAPTCRPNQTRVHGVAKQEEANISCEVEANPGDVQFRWTFNNSAESVDVASSHIKHSGGTTSVVSYTPNTELDYGTLLCWATNKIGHQRVPCVFHIIAAGRPDQVHNCTVANTSMTSFSLRCSEGFNGGLKQSFLLELRESHSQTLRVNVSSPVPRFSVAGLEPGALYQACVYSYNLKGRSEAVPVQAATLRLPEKQLTNEKERPRAGFRFTPMMSVLIGVISALIIVACVVSIVLRLQCSRNEDRRKRHKAAAEMETASMAGSGDKNNGSPINKMDAGGAESGDSDEKNPDIIPQPNTGDADDHLDYLRKRQHISTIETMSPSRSLLQSNLPEYAGYCTLRNGIPMKDLGMSKQKMQNADMMYAAGGGCTLPRQHWPTYAGGVAGVGVRHQGVPMCAQYPSPVGHHHPHPQQHPQQQLQQQQHPQQHPSQHPHMHRPAGPPMMEMTVSAHKPTHGMVASVASAASTIPEDDHVTAETPLMVTKRESTV